MNHAISKFSDCVIVVCLRLCRK